jgi:hypothetical protein
MLVQLIQKNNIINILSNNNDEFINIMQIIDINKNIKKQRFPCGNNNDEFINIMQIIFIIEIFNIFININNIDINKNIKKQRCPCGNNNACGYCQS